MIHKILKYLNRSSGNPLEAYTSNNQSLFYNRFQIFNEDTTKLNLSAITS